MRSAPSPHSRPAGIPRRALSVMVLAVIAGSVSPVSGSSLERYLDLLEARRALLRENAILEIESRTAAHGEPYILLDLESPALEFRIRGKSLKRYAITAIALDPHGRVPADAQAIRARFPGPLSVEEVQGGQPELIPPDPEAGRETGLLFSDPDQLRSQTGAIPVDADAGILGIEVPAEYWIRFDAPLMLRIRTERTASMARQALDRLAEMAGSVKDAWSRLWGGQRLPAEAPLHLWLTLEPDIARQLHHSLLPGERIWIVPPVPPPLQVAPGMTHDDGNRAEARAVPAAD